MRVLLLLCALPLSGCGAVVGQALADGAIARTEGIPAMSCAELRARWQEVSGPGAFLNPTRLTAAERSLIRQTAAARGCPVT